MTWMLAALLHEEYMVLAQEFIERLGQNAMRNVERALLATHLLDLSKSEQAAEEQM